MISWDKHLLSLLSSSILGMILPLLAGETNLISLKQLRKDSKQSEDSTVLSWTVQKSKETEKLTSPLR